MTHRTARSAASLPTALRRHWRPAVAGAGLLWALASGPAQAQNLQTLFEAARGYDAVYLSALSQFQASQARAEQAKAGVRPNVGLSAGASWTNTDTNLPGGDRTTNGQTAALAASQPLFRPVNRLAVEQAEASLRAAEAQLRAAEQDLIVRSAQAYFDVLAAQDTLTFVRAQKAAVAEQLAAAQRNFEVGTATITDTREAQARFDLVTAQEIAADNDRRVKHLALDQLVGQAQTTPWRLDTRAPLPALAPAELAPWVEQAETGHPQVQQALAGQTVAQLETRKAEATRLPTLDATAQYQVGRGPTTGVPYSYVRSHNATVGLQFNLPLYTGGAVQNRIAETLALENKARTDLDAARRGVAQATRAAYFGVVSGQGQVRALEAAEASSQSALEANQLGYQVGVRINIDVLNAQSQLFQTKASLAKARYDVLVGGLRLRQASGGLQPGDLAPINALLAP
ncbi:TolC family outer membrane protein [Aquabacterium sp. A08]|uniref:TolC family outer membrane protein n=1 Tax=Aquabacterium sp. A08 TaxID=2718532 RepID=UPI00141F69EF|nr:TolC family outer membrane protein [Aquabacterium sp. A08]NIC43064.1 TolC family outer membrane protein [Aquabacterium sp. A08]